MDSVTITKSNAAALANKTNDPTNIYCFIIVIYGISILKFYNQK